MSDDVRKRTVRAQLTNGALEARAYVETGVSPRADLHKTFEMRKVQVDPELDPRLRKTVARGMGEPVHALHGAVVDPVTGDALPPPGADPNPASPWKIGKRPTRARLPVPELRTAATTGVARSAATQPRRLAYVAAAAIVVAGVAAAIAIASLARRAPAFDAAAGGLREAGAARDARPAPTGGLAASPSIAPAPVAAPPSGAPPATSTVAAASAPGAPSAPPAAERPAAVPAAAPSRVNGTSPARPPASATARPGKRPGGRIF
jgi:hypothetical protein